MTQADALRGLINQMDDCMGRVAIYGPTDALDDIRDTWQRLRFTLLDAAEAPEPSWWVRLSELLGTGGMDDPAFIYGQIQGLLASRVASAPCWQPIETAPKGQEVLVVSGSRVYVAEYIRDADAEIEGWYFSAQAKSSADWPDPTHWMPLPLPPSSGHDKETV